MADPGEEYEEMELPVLHSEYSGKSSEDECTSACGIPCMNERHMETLIFQDIVNRAFEENDLDNSEEGVLKQLFEHKAPKSKFS